MTISIRPAKKNDIPLVLGLLYELGRPKPQTDSDLDSFRNLVKKQISDFDKTILVAELNDVNVVGMVSVIFLPRLNQIRPEMYIPELIVTERYRNQGIGTDLINSCISLAKQKECQKIRLESGIQRKKAHQFYINLGFESNSLSFTKTLLEF
jgi:ribosomal protein S18 acetylase RimI-like enzyme